MSQDWGLGKLSTAFQTRHNDIYPAIDPQPVTLPDPFVVCIVGASRGIGAGIALAYAKAGATGLVLASRRTSGLEETAAACRGINPNTQIEIVSCDITKADSVSALAEQTKAVFGGRLDVVTVNSGYSGPVVLKLHDTDPETFQQASNVNYVGTFLCAKYLIPLLLATENGAKAFIAVSSLAALIVRGPVANPQYCTSKTAQLRLLEYVHECYHAEGLNAFAVHPGAVKTEMAESAPKEFVPHLVDAPELCGGLCVWLTKGERAKKEKDWLSGRLLSANWDVDELEAMKADIIQRDLLKLGMVAPMA